MSRTFLNTGIRALNAFNFLYDGTGGYIGPQLNGLASASAAFLNPVIAAKGAWALPARFSTDLPVLLQGHTTLELAGASQIFSRLQGRLRTLPRGQTIQQCGESGSRCVVVP